MKKLILASVSALALFGVAACSDRPARHRPQSVPATQTTEPATACRHAAATPAGNRRHDHAEASAPDA